MNIILTNCMFGQRKIGVENAPKLIYNNLFNYKKIGVNTNISSISSEKFQSNSSSFGLEDGASLLLLCNNIKS